MKKWTPVALLLIVVSVAIGMVLSSSPQQTQNQQEVKSAESTPNPSIKSSQSNKMNLTPPKLTIDSNISYLATLKTSEGDITIKLFADKTPITVNNFIHLAQESFYNNTIFHRAISGFMIQGGDPNGDGTGGPGYKFNDEPFEGEYKRGAVAMANSGPNTNGSQFFIMHQDYPLPPNYVIFGQVTGGLEIVDKIASAEVTLSSSGENSKPLSPVKIISVAITQE